MDDSIVARLRAAGCVFAEEEAALLIDAATDPDDLERLVSDRVRGLPLEHLLGWAEFGALRILVEPGVFVPRRRTGFLVERALDLCASESTVLDLCCGAGAIGAAMLTGLPRLTMLAADIDPAAVRSARRNLEPLGGQVFGGDLFEAIPTKYRGGFDVIVANAPYVPTEAIALMPPEARLHEARVALDGGADGLDVQRRIAARAPEWLRPGGHLLVEASDGQAATSAAIFEAAGLVASVVSSDEFEATVVIGAKP
jgi:release factor glutamine methyltransferase